MFSLCKETKRYHPEASCGFLTTAFLFSLHDVIPGCYQRIVFLWEDYPDDTHFFCLFTINRFEFSQSMFSKSLLLQIESD